MTSSTKQNYNMSMLGAGTLRHSRDVSSGQMTLRAKVMVKVTMTFRIALSSGPLFYGF